MTENKLNYAKSAVTLGVAATLLAGTLAQSAVAAQDGKSASPSSITTTDLKQAEASVQNLNPNKGNVISVETSEKSALTGDEAPRNEKPVTGGDNPGAVMGQSLREAEKSRGFLGVESSEALKSVANKLPDAPLKQEIYDKAEAETKAPVTAENNNPVTGAAAVTPSVFAAASTWKPAGIQGLDVSGHQPVINWSSQWSQGARFAYVKATEGNYYVSEAFADQYEASYNVGMIRGSYHFANPEVGSGAAQADYFINNGGGWSADGKTLPGLLDVEYNPYGQICYNMSQDQMRSWIRAFSDRYKARTGRLPAIYSTTDWWKTCTGNTKLFNDHPLHIAAYNTTGAGELFAGRANYDIWQYSDDGPFAGDSNSFSEAASKLTDLARNKSYVPIGGVAPAGTATTKPTTPAPAAQETTSYTVKGGIAGKYREAGGAAKLGNPTMNERSDGQGGVYQEFKIGSSGTTIYWSSKYGAKTIQSTGAVGKKWAAAGKAAGYGYPTSDEVKLGDGAVYQTFIQGAKVTKVMWTPGSNVAYAVKEWEKVGQKWTSAGFERGYGYPTSDSRVTADGGSYQTFKKDAASYKIMWHASTGKAAVIKESGAIGNKWKMAGFERGYGYPMGDEKSEGNGVMSQTFKKGRAVSTVYWRSGSPTTAVKTTGAIGKFWATTGGLNGFGYPVTDEYRTGNEVTQKFSAGVTLIWDSAQNTVRVTR